MKRIFNLLVFLSFVFVGIYLWKQNLIIPVLPDPIWLLPSMVLLFAGFYVSTLSWKTALHVHDIRISTSDALISHGMSVFAKYIPGKIWVILGRAGYISDDRKSLKNTSFVSFKEQLIYAWVGLLISAIPTFIYYRFQLVSLALMTLTLLLTLFLFVQPIHALGIWLLQKMIRRKFDIPVINIRKSLPVIFTTLLIWIAWTAAFILFCKIFTTSITPWMGFAFPLSVTLGLAAIILPGGLGLREGIIVGFLSLAGMEIETATTIAFLNRFAFIAGEVFIFLLAFAVRIMKKRNV